MGDNTGVSHETLSAIDACVQNAVQAALHAAMENWQQKVAVLEERIESLETENTNLKKFITKATTISAIKQIDDDVYSRKWNLIIHGLTGEKGEKEENTERKVREMASAKLGIETSSTTPFAACHRLSQNKDAGIIIKFVNLNDKNVWLSKASGLKNCAHSLSISPDIPPILKPLKSDLLQHRKTLPPATKSRSKIKYHKTWPYITLHLPDGKIYNPEISLSDITKRFYTHASPEIFDFSLF